MNGQFVWYELTTPDVEAAKKFYPRVAGWGTQAFDRDYTMWTNGGVPIAGLFQLSDEMRQQGVPPNWMPYVESSNVDETAAKAVSLGGRVVHGPVDIPGTGRFAVVQDPHSAVFGVYRPDNPGRAWDGTPVVGRFSWHELMTTDHTAAFEFYRALFGWEKTGEMDMGGGQTYLMFGQGGKMYGGIFTRPPEMAGMHPFWLIYIHVKDVARAVAAATKAGATVHRPQMDIPGGSIAILGDPQGAGFAFHHTNTAVPASKSAAKTSVKKVVKKAVKQAAKTAKKAAKTAKTAAKAVKKVVKKAAKKTTKKAAAKKTPKKTPKKRSTAAPRPKARRKAAARKTKSASRPNARAKTKRRR
jgi:uncharacterized protein